ncbi:DUF7453 family protein [Dapis sp. BLCC M229]|uniref:DUF7453 family protein n=1 Tax=Dapis sp. BLCC M229 TaxID=3400188 RepID=UPI003CED19CC
MSDSFPLFSDNSNDLSVIVDSNTLIPDETGNSFGGNFGPPSINNNGEIAFVGSDGVYTTVGGLNQVVDTNTPIPGNDFNNFENYSGLLSLNDNGNVTFAGGAFPTEGIYTDLRGLNVVADINTPIPGSTENFDFVNVPAINNDGTIVFGGSNSFTSGEIYSNAAGVLNSFAVIVYNSENGNLFYNPNGSETGFGDGGQFATLTNTPLLEAEDFVLRG